MDPNQSDAKESVDSQKQEEKTSTENTMPNLSPSSNENPKKRAAEAEDDVSDSAAEESSKRSRSEVLDLADVIGLKAGDRIEVEWQIGDDGDEETSAAESHWWGATLQEFDWRLEDGVAIRVLDYDPYPEKGFPERSKEDVIFLRPDVVVKLPSQEELRFRRAGDEDAVWVGRNDMEDVVNSVLVNAMQKNSQAWKGMSRAQQATIAGQIAGKKEKLVQLLLNHESRVITSTDMQELLSKAVEEQD